MGDALPASKKAPKEEEKKGEVEEKKESGEKMYFAIIQLEK